MCATTTKLSKPVSFYSHLYYQILHSSSPPNPYPTAFLLVQVCLYYQTVHCSFPPLPYLIISVCTIKFCSFPPLPYLIISVCTIKFCSFPPLPYLIISVCTIKFCSFPPLPYLIISVCTTKFCSFPPLPYLIISVCTIKFCSFPPLPYSIISVCTIKFCSFPPLPYLFSLQISCLQVQAAASFSVSSAFLSFLSIKSFTCSTDLCTHIFSHSTQTCNKSSGIVPKLATSLLA